MSNYPRTFNGTALDVPLRLAFASEISFMAFDGLSFPSALQETQRQFAYASISPTVAQPHENELDLSSVHPRRQASLSRLFCEIFAHTIRYTHRVTRKSYPKGCYLRGQRRPLVDRRSQTSHVFSCYSLSSSSRETPLSLEARQSCTRTSHCDYKIQASWTHRHTRVRVHRAKMRSRSPWQPAYTIRSRSVLGHSGTS